jgi:hypothetical protein
MSPESAAIARRVVDPKALVETISQALEDPTYVVAESDEAFVRFDTGHAYLAHSSDRAEHVVRVTVALVSDGEDEIDGAGEQFEIVVRRVAS